MKKVIEIFGTQDELYNIKRKNMTTWKIKINNKIYAEFKFNKELKIVSQSDQAIQDNLSEKLKKIWNAFDPRHNSLRDINDPKTIYDADLFLAAIFYDRGNYTIESEGLDWSKVLSKSLPGTVN
jgi:hypothetical protein